MVPKGFIRFEVMATIKVPKPKTYYLHLDGKFPWIIPTNGEPSEIHSHNAPHTGYGGRVLFFPLDEEDKLYKAKGPWHRNADDLFAATGIDLRNNHLTLGIVALERRSVKHKGMANDYRGILHLDENEIRGEFDRIPKLAQKIANERGEDVVYQVITAGGGRLGTKKPEGL